MPTVIAIAIAVLIFVIWVRRSGAGATGQPRSQKRNCDWVRVDPDSTRTLQEYKCATCKETGFGRADRPPLECKRRISQGG